MRRKDREITDPNAIFAVIEQCHVCRLGFCDDGDVYIVPLHFGYERDEARATLYFHGAREGRKMALIAKNPRVGFEMDTGADVYTKGAADVACGYTARFQSVIGTGSASLVHDTNEKRRALELLMSHSVEKRDWTFDERMLAAVAVFKVEVEKMSCKSHE